MNSNKHDSFYNDITQQMLYNRVTQDDLIYIENNNININILLFTRWHTIVNSLSSSYYNEYISLDTNILRNEWFQKYLNLPSKNIMELPLSLL